MLCGGSEYSAQAYWEYLPNALRDAEAVASALKDLYGYDTIVLRNPTQEELEKQLLYLSEQLQPNHQLFLYFAGHGGYDSARLDDGFLVCRNSLEPEQDPMRNSYLAYSRLERFVNRLPARQIMLVLDVCFGASFDSTLSRCAETMAYAGEPVIVSLQQSRFSEPAFSFPAAPIARSRRLRLQRIAFAFCPSFSGSFARQRRRRRISDRNRPVQFCL